MWPFRRKPRVIYLDPANVNLSPTAIRELQDALNATVVEMGLQDRVIVLPPASKIMR